MCKTDLITLTAGKWEYEARPSFGMNVCALRLSGREILRSPADFETLAASPYLYGIPLLFPANRTKGGAFEFEGKSYCLPINEPARGNHIHGLMFDAPFSVTEQTQSRVKAVYVNKDQRYPFPFRMEIEDALSQTGFTRKLTLTNTGNAPFPYTLAFHTTFCAPERLTVPVKNRFLCDENYIPTGEQIALSDLEKQFEGGISPGGHALSGFYESGGHEAELDNILFRVSDNFDEWVVFNAGGDKGFVCVEPQAGEVNGLNHAGGARTIAPRESHEFALSVTEK